MANDNNEPLINNPSFIMAGVFAFFSHQIYAYFELMHTQFLTNHAFLILYVITNTDRKPPTLDSGNSRREYGRRAKSIRWLLKSPCYIKLISRWDDLISERLEVKALNNHIAR